ncbi:MAG: type II toxin-antitoxin system HicA family toxin [Candidatus Limisoma sp.]|nr:type II toxin-antitoxin system HicA family toxin [Bacteroidales bacterium]MDD6668635.1 type II toxin-antitoxin system HicA family toxin [Bacteroidales bacterium]
MKISELIKIVSKAGCRFLRSGGRHDIWINPQGEKFPLPRHQSEEVPKGLEKAAKKWAGVK